MPDLVDLVAADELRGCEMLESDIEQHTKERLAALAPGIRVALARAGKLHDCWRAASLWQRALESEHVAFRLCSEPDPEDQLGADFTRMTDAERGGYELDGGVIKRHVWLAVGPGLSLFDPTAHQFDGCGRSAIGRYWRQHSGARIAFTTWRALEMAQSA